MAAVRTTTTTCISPHIQTRSLYMYIRETDEGPVLLSLSYLFTPLDILYVGAGLMWIYFNSCIVYTIPAHITYSTANSFLHTRPYTPADIWQHMFTYLDSPLYLAGQKKKTLNVE